MCESEKASPEWGDELRCPYCGAADPEVGKRMRVGVRQSQVVTCWKCWKDYMASVRIGVSFSARQLTVGEGRSYE